MTYFGLAKLFMVSLFIPGEFHLNLGGLRLELYRIILAIPVVGELSKIVSRKSQYETVDKLVLLASTWGVVSLIMNHGMGGGIEKSGIFAIEVMGGYFLAKNAIANADQLIAVYKRLLLMVVLFMIPSVFEMLTGIKVVHNLAEAMTGNKELGPALYTEDYVRMGMTRATGAHAHPILNGVICVTAMPIAVYLYLERKNFKRFFAVLSVFASVFSALSSAPLLVLAVDMMLVAYVITKKKLKENIRYLVYLVIAAAVLIEVVSNRGIVKIIIHTATFNPHTGTHRLLIIEHLKDDIMRSPFFGSGIGARWTAPFWMGQSIDNFWWAIAFMYGIPYALMIAAVGFISLHRIQVSPIPQKSDNLAYAMKALILGLMVLGLTVHLFDRINPLFYFALGSAAYMLRRSEKAKKRRI